MPPPAQEIEDLTVRSYAPADWAEVCRVHDAARVQELATGRVDPRAFETMENIAEADEFFASQVLVACVSGAVVGFVAWNGAYITWLYIQPTHQRRGIGRRLLFEAVRRIGPEAWTNVIAGNETALGLYTRSGMELVWVRSGECNGYACNLARLALPSSRMREPAAVRQASAV
jgi:ribosomal protein S18 acetylase RimI-like enzyme